MKDRRVCFFGDSLTAGTGDESGQGWVGRLQQIENAGSEQITAYNLGIRRDTSRRIALRWRQEWASRQSPTRRSAIVIMFGINDTGGAEMDFDGADQGMRVAQQESLDIARQMITAMTACGPVFWLGPTPLIESRMEDGPAESGLPSRLQRLADLSDGYRGIAQLLGVPYLDIRFLLDTTDGYLRSLEAGDGVHPTGSGHQLIAEIMTAWPAWRHFIDS